MPDNGPVVFVVDDDTKHRQSLAWLLKGVGLEVRAYESAREFLQEYAPARWGCLLLDLRMPHMGGLELQELLKARGIRLPTIIVTGHGEVPSAVRAMKAGAVDFIEKPFAEQVLIECVQRAVENARHFHETVRKQAALASRLAQLTPRETEVMNLIVAGLRNKEVALRLGLSERTVEIHRAGVMRKLAVSSLAELVRVAGSAGDPHPGTPGSHAVSF
jgi:FixJ family two-component response regulator